MARIEVVVYECDANSCTKQSDTEDGVPVEGFFGMVFDDKKEFPEWFACSERHIKQAVMNVLNGEN